jgi:hypothetical protein
VFGVLQNLVQTASTILDVKYRDHWHRVTDLTGETAEDLVLSFNRYIATLAQSQDDTYTSPFEVVAENMGETIFRNLSVEALQVLWCTVHTLVHSNGHHHHCKELIPDFCCGRRCNLSS